VSDKRETWMSAMLTAGHSPIMNDAHLDTFAYVAGDYHNGPACASCGWGTCWHCDTVKDIPACTVPAQPQPAAVVDNKPATDGPQVPLPIIGAQQAGVTEALVVAGALALCGATQPPQKPGAWREEQKAVAKRVLTAALSARQGEGGA
jgi:hypothetical protein